MNIFRNNVTSTHVRDDVILVNVMAKTKQLSLGHETVGIIKMAW